MQIIFFILFKNLNYIFHQIVHEGIEDFKKKVLTKSAFAYTINSTTDNTVKEGVHESCNNCK